MQIPRPSPPPKQPLPLLWWVTKVVGFCAATWFLAVPQLPLVWDALHALADIRFVTLAIGFSLAFAALLAYAQLTRTLLDDGHRPGLWHSFAIMCTSLGVNRILPAGVAASSIVTFKLLERAGVVRRRAAFAMTTQGIGSAIVLNLLLWMALLAALPIQGFGAGYTAGIVAGTIVLGSSFAILDGIYNGRRWILRFGAWAGRVLPKIQPEQAQDFLHDQKARLRDLTERPATLRKALFWAVSNWLFDAAALYVFLVAFDVNLDPRMVLVAFGLANAAAMLPSTPGGLGVVELTMTATLVGFGAPPVSTALGVAAYRVFNYWIPIPASAIAYMAIRHINVPNQKAAEADDQAA